MRYRTSKFNDDDVLCNIIIYIHISVPGTSCYVRFVAKEKIILTVLRQQHSCLRYCKLENIIIVTLCILECLFMGTHFRYGTITERDMQRGILGNKKSAEEKLKVRDSHQQIRTDLLVMCAVVDAVSTKPLQ